MQKPKLPKAPKYPTRYALLKCSAQSRFASFKLGKISVLHFFMGDFLSGGGVLFKKIENFIFLV